MQNKTIYNANGIKVEFVDSSAEIIEKIEKLSKEALGASAKVIRKKLRSELPVRTNHFKNHVASWKFIDKKTGQPTLQVGFYGWQRVKKKNKVPSHANPHWIEFGTKPHIIRSKRAKSMGWKTNYFGKEVAHPGQKAAHLLRETVLNNIDEIRAAQEEYLKKINDVINAADLHIQETQEEEDS